MVTVYVEGSDAAMGAVKTGRLHLIDPRGPSASPGRGCRRQAQGGATHQQEPGALGDVIAALLRSARTSVSQLAAHQALSDRWGVPRCAPAHVSRRLRRRDAVDSAVCAALLPG